MHSVTNISLLFLYSSFRQKQYIAQTAIQKTHNKTHKNLYATDSCNIPQSYGTWFQRYGAAEKTEQHTIPIVFRILLDHKRGIRKLQSYVGIVTFYVLASKSGVWQFIHFNHFVRRCSYRLGCMWTEHFKRKTIWTYALLG